MASSETYYFEVTVVDSRVKDDEVASEIYSVRARDAESARSKAMLRGDFEEGDLEYLDFIPMRLAAVKAYNADADFSLLEEDEDEDNG